MRKERNTRSRSQPHANQHRHLYVSYMNVSGTSYYLCSVLDGYCRSIVHWDLGDPMTEAETEVILQRAREKYPEAKPRIISDNGSQCMARDFKEFIRIVGMTLVRTSPLPAIERQTRAPAQSLKSECLQPGTPLRPGEAEADFAGMQPC
jgi:putative transposase